MPSCTSVIDKPAAAEVSTQTDQLATQAKDYYGTIIQGYNGMLFNAVALNRGCTWGRSIALHSEESTALVQAERQRLLSKAKRDRAARARIAHDFPGEGCVTEKERVFLARRALTDGNLVRTVPLNLLSQQTFGVQFDLLAVLTKYSKVLADLADAPKVTTKEDLLAIVDQLASVRNDANSVAAAWQSLGGPPPAGTTRPDFIKFNVTSLRGHVERIGGLISLIQTIAEDADDARKIRRLALDKEPEVNRAIAGLRQSFIDNFGTLVLLAQNQELTNLEIIRRSNNLGFTERRALIAAVAANEAEVARLTQMLATQTEAGDDPAKAVIPQVKMADGLRKANDNLVRIARGRYSDAEKRAIALATLRNLRDVFKSAASAAAPLLAL
jgi:hypothetical protein